MIVFKIIQINDDVHVKFQELKVETLNIASFVRPTKQKDGMCVTFILI